MNPTPATFADCSLLQELHHGENTVVWRGRREPSGLPIVLKVIHDESPHRDRLNTLAKEVEINSRLENVPGVVRCLGIARDGLRSGLLFEDTDSTSLKASELAGRLSPLELIELACDVTVVLGNIHEQRVIHKSINPSNIIRSREGRVHVIDFRIATVLREERPTYRTPTATAGTLAYISPEQTGRTNRSIDYRSDYYSLGITLYELATGAPPFTSDQPVELIHAHVAQQPRPACQVSPTVPRCLSNVIAKLLAKDADDRYQTTAGILADLRQCQTLISSGQDLDLAPGLADYSTRFRFSDRLYGRQRELETLLRALDDTNASEPPLVLVTGSAGVGKSMLVNELRRPLAAQRGYFLPGKFEAGSLKAPYLALRQALSAFVDQVLGETADQIAEWKARILKSVPTPGLLVEACPSMELIVGPQPPVGHLPPVETQTRLHQTFYHFCATIASAGRPVCLFLDDIQWAGADSIRLIREIQLASDRHRLLVICASRGDGASASAMLGSEFSSQEGLGRRRIVNLDVQPLTPDAVRDLLHGCMRLAPADATNLAVLIHGKTAGNPFFVKTFLLALHANGLLGGQGEIQFAKISEQAVTDNVGSLLVNQIEDLPSETQEVLLTAACLGSRFEIDGLRLLAPESSLTALWPAIETGLILSLDAVSAPSELGGDRRLRFKFAHDRIQQAVLASVGEDVRKRIHLALGRSLRSSGAGGFDVVGQLNEARDLIEDADERLTLSQANLQAAKVALAGAAGVRAAELGKIGADLLGEERWRDHFDLALELELTTAEGHYVAGDFGQFEKVASDVSTHARTPLDSLPIRRRLGEVSYGQGDAAGAIETYVKALRDLGIDLPEAVEDDDVQRELLLTSEAIGARTFEDLVGLPTCQDKELSLAMPLLSKLIFATLVSNSRLQTVVVCRLVRLSITHGHVAESANGFIFYGLLLTFRQELERAVSFARVAMQIAERFQDRSVRSQTCLYAPYQLLHWTTPISELAPVVLAGHRHGVEAGESLLAAMAATTYCIAGLLSGRNLGDLAKDMAHFHRFVVQSKQAMVITWHEIFQQTVENLTNDKPAPSVLVGSAYDEDRAPAAKLLADQNFSGLFNFHFAKMNLAYLYNQPEAALESADATRSPALSFFASAFWAVPITYLDSLCRLLVVDDQPLRREELLSQVAENQAKLLAWLPLNRQSIEHKVALIEAELARVQGERDRADQGYVRASDLARIHGYAHEEGIACERAGRFFLSSGDRRRARMYLRQAQRAFGRWGAESKVKHLQAEFPHLLPKALAGSVTVSDLARGEDRDFDVVDLVSILNGSRAVSGEIRTEALLQQLLRVAMECGGAQAVYVILASGNGWVVEAATQIGQEMLRSIPIGDLPTLGYPKPPSAVLNYAARTGQCVLLDDAAKSSRFGHDPEISEREVASVMCLPLLRQGNLLGLLYLENALAKGAFSANVAVVLEVVAAQAAISLENARLYGNLERDVELRTDELRQANRKLEQALARQELLRHQIVTQEKLAALGALTAGIAHEIKNPLNFVMNFGQAALRLTDDIAEQLSGHPGSKAHDPELAKLLLSLRQATAKVVEHGMRANGIVADMGKHGVQAGHQKRESFHVNALVAETLKLAEAQGQDSFPINIVTDYSAEAGSVDGISRDMHRVFLNLLTNSRHALAAKRQHVGNAFLPEIRVTTRTTEDMVEVSIRDNGVGIPFHNLEKLFTPFFTTKSPGEGTGLGLSISHDIVTRLHRGLLRVQSIEGEYAEFVVSLPRRRLSDHEAMATTEGGPMLNSSN